MNSASRGLRPTVGLRRPGGAFCVGEGRRPARERLGRPISIGVKAFGRRSTCAPNEFGLQGPSANGRPAPTGRCLLRRRRPTPGAQRLGRPISIGVKAFGRRSACADREGVFCVGGGRRLARKRLRRPISIGRSGFSRDHCGIEEKGFGVEGSSFPMTAVAIGTLIRGESPSYKKRSSCGSGFSRDRGGIEKTGVAVQKALPSEMIAAAIGTLSPESEGAGRKKAPRGAERDPGRLPPASPRWGRAASSACSRPIRGRDAPQRIPTWL